MDAMLNNRKKRQIDIQYRYFSIYIQEQSIFSPKINSVAIG